MSKNKNQQPTPSSFESEKSWFWLERLEMKDTSGTQITRIIILGKDGAAREEDAQKPKKKEPQLTLTLVSIALASIGILIKILDILPRIRARPWWPWFWF